MSLAFPNTEINTGTVGMRLPPQNIEAEMCVFGSLMLFFYFYDLDKLVEPSQEIKSCVLEFEFSQLKYYYPYINS